MNAPKTAQRCLAASVLAVVALAIYCATSAWPTLRAYPHIVEKYVTALVVLSIFMSMNLACWLLLLVRIAFLKETGQKLVHFEKQLLTGETSAEGLARRFQER
jgi:hypothetical protein